MNRICARASGAVLCALFGCLCGFAHGCSAGYEEVAAKETDAAGYNENQADGQEDSTSRWESGPQVVSSGSESDSSVASTPGNEAGTGVGVVDEECNGWDDDGDGEVDEGFGVEVCDLANGEQGWLFCDGIASRRELVCRQCEWGEQRSAACGCGQVRFDLCNASGLWRLGTCDGCEPEEQCQCEPGEKRHRPCDGTCKVKSEICNNTCQWEQETLCYDLQVAECTGEDDPYYEPCGACGRREVVCDGCAWIKGECEEEGICNPGETRYLACTNGSNCQSGYHTTTVCTNNCEWAPPPSCEGCEIGFLQQRQVECVAGASACGHYVETTECVLVNEVESCNEPISIGELVITNNADDVCNTVCTPGQTTTVACTLDSGQPGEQVQTCGDDCQWLPPGGPCGAVNGSCVPNAVIETETVTCGSGACQATYERTVTCNASGTATTTNTSGAQDCPECSPGQTDRRSCTTDDGRCGYTRVSCDESTCNWDDQTGVCEPRANSCVPGTTEQLPCGDNTCGATYTRTCKANGCGYRVDNSTCPSCTPGEQQERTCGGGCSLESRTCTNQCEWGAWSACEPLQHAECTAGDINYVSCTGLCGSGGQEKWACDSQSCQWELVQACDAQPPCTPGEVVVTDEECVPGHPDCGTKRKQCSEDCQWQYLSCPSCG